MQLYGMRKSEGITMRYGLSMDGMPYINAAQKLVAITLKYGVYFPSIMKEFSNRVKVFAGCCLWCARCSGDLNNTQ